MIISIIRSTIFNIFYVFWTIAAGTVAIPALLGPWHWSVTVGRLWGRGLVRAASILCGITWRVEGLENLPKGPCIVACKHQSAWETLFLPMILYRAAFVLKKELLSVPFVGWYMRHGRMISIDRSAGASALKLMLRQADQAVADGRPVIIFPEGTRTAPGVDAPYHPGVAALYNRLGDKAPVVPVALNSGVFWPRNAFLKKPGEIVVRILPPLPPGLDRRAFGEALKETVDRESNALLPGADSSSAK